MAEVTAQMVKELRERTGAGMMDCKNALNECQGQPRDRGRHAAQEGPRRGGQEGRPGHGRGRRRLATSTAAARSACWSRSTARPTSWPAPTSSRSWCATSRCTSPPPIPRCVRREEVTPELLEREQAIFREQALASGKPAQVVEKIVDGKIEKYYSEFVLLEQPFVKDPDQTDQPDDRREGRQDRREHPGAPFRPLQAGRGIEKRQDDFAAEVMAQAGQ